jgi:single-stranded-DNA-specific exonuclease
MIIKRWLVAPALSESARTALAAYPPLVAQLLHNRHVETMAEAERFFAGQLDHTGDPTQLTGLPQAVDRLHHAAQAGERIVVYGDYDTDGVTATALLVQVLRSMGADAHAYIPLREEEGYGLNVEALRKLKLEQAVDVVVSVDCGVRSLAEAEAARDLGLDLIITDHHQPAEELPRAFAIINPKQPGDPYPEKGLAGVGLAFKLAQGLIRRLAARPIAASDVLDLVALGTVADLAPLSGENRVLVRQGLGVINRAKRTGLKALMEVARLRPGQVDASAIGYSLGPRLNAAGRLESALAAYDLLTTRTNSQAWELAQRLETQNRERQELTRWTQQRARELAQTQYGDGALLFAADPEFKPGVVGLAAARLTEEFYRPAVVATLGPEETKGSCRSIPEFHMTDALDQCRALLIKHGGHAAAAGFTLRSADVNTLAEKLKGIAEAALGEMDLRPTQRVDVDAVPLRDLNRDLVECLRQFEPCGFDNPTPVLASRGVKVASSRTVGSDGKHLKLTLSDGRSTFDAIAFGQAPNHPQVPAYVDVAYCLELNEWNGEQRLQLNVKNLKQAGQD